MTKIFTAMTFAALLVIGFAAPASAQFKGTASQPGTNSGMCQPGTCAPNGGQRARNVQNCAASNCKKPQSRKAK